MDTRASLALRAAQRLEARALEVGEHAAAGLALRNRAARLRQRARRLVDPGDTGPVDPEDGYMLDVAHRAELEAADRSCVLVRFLTSAHRFDGAGWFRLESTTVAAGAILTPTTFPTDLPIDQLAEAWESTSSARESDRRTRAAREAREASVSELLDED